MNRICRFSLSENGLGAPRCSEGRAFGCIILVPLTSCFKRYKLQPNVMTGLIHISITALYGYQDHKGAVVARNNAPSDVGTQGISPNEILDLEGCGSLS
jgi:hypothetical protein